METAGIKYDYGALRYTVFEAMLMPFALYVYAGLLMVDLSCFIRPNS